MARRKIDFLVTYESKKEIEGENEWLERSKTHALHLVVNEHVMTVRKQIERQACTNVVNPHQRDHPHQCDHQRGTK
jgi:hypothetical protein